MDIKKLVEVLKSPSVYPDNPKEVRFLETHISYLFLTGTYVYKVKKPINFGFLDFSTLEKRKFFCRQEVKLNSRLSPDIYLGVEEIREEDDRISIGGKGETIEYAVKMKELPSEGMLSRLVAESNATADLMERIAFKTALFHGEAETSREIAEFGNISAIKKNLQENFIQAAPYIGRTISKEQYDYLSSKAVEFLEKNAGTFLRRKAEGRVRDCHGDMHLGSICIEGDCIHIFDCIEFNDRFRYFDTAGDVSFLTMDLEFNDRFELSNAFTKAYIRYSGDTDIPLVLRFYKSYRAFVRGKVTSFLLDEDVSEERKAQALSTARAYFGLAYSYYMQPTLIIMAGLVGSGKTTVAKLLGERIGGKVLRSDIIRKTIAGIPLEEHIYEGYEGGIYTEDITRRTYDELHRKASEFLNAGRPTISDASYKSRAERETASSTAREKGARFFIIECVCDDKTIKSRLTKRLEEKEVSDGRWEIYERQKQEFEYITENEGRFIRVDTTRPVEETVELIMKVIGR